MGYIGMCRFEGYGFQAVQSGIGYINQRVWVQNRISFSRKLINWLKIIFSLDQGNRELPLKNINKIKSILFWLDCASVLSTFRKTTTLGQQSKRKSFPSTCPSDKHYTCIKFGCPKPKSSCPKSLVQNSKLKNNRAFNAFNPTITLVNCF